MLPLGGSAPPQHRRVLGDEHVATAARPLCRSRATSEFFTLCDVHLEHERTSQAACLQRRHEQLFAAGAFVLCGRGFPFSAPRCRRAAAHTAGGASCREDTTCLRTCNAHSMSPHPYQSHVLKIIGWKIFFCRARPF